MMLIQRFWLPDFGSAASGFLERPPWLSLCSAKNSKEPASERDSPSASYVLANNSEWVYVDDANTQVPKSMEESAPCGNCSLPRKVDETACSERLESESTATGASTRSSGGSSNTADDEAAALPNDIEKNEPHELAAGGSDSDAAALGRKATRQKSWRKSRRISTVLRNGMQSLPYPRAPQRGSPLFSQHIDKMLSEIRDDFAQDDECVIKRFLRDVMECFDISSSDWMDSEDVDSNMVKSFEYKSKIPSDVPDAVVRLCRLPQTILGSTIVHLCSNDDELTVVQHSRTRNVLYGDRFLLQNTMSFQKEPSGGVMLRQWTEVVWIEPLPWTHGIVKFFIERKAKSGARETADDFACIIREGGLVPSEPMQRV